MHRRELQWIEGFYFGLENIVTAHFLIKVWRIYFYIRFNRAAALTFRAAPVGI